MIEITVKVYTFKDFVPFWRRSIFKFWRKLRKWFGIYNSNGVLLIMAFFICGVVMFELDLEIFILISFIFSLFYWRIDSKIPFAFALSFLVLIPFLQIGDQTILPGIGEFLSEKTAVWVFYLLVLGTIKAFVENILEKERRNKSKKLLF